MSEPVWKDVYDKMGVTAEELYLRQTGKCYLEAEIDDSGAVEIYCTDGEDKAPTSCMLNPTIECAKCMTKNLVRVIKNGIKVDK